MIHYRIGQDEYGPIGQKELIALIQSGKLSPADLIRRDNGEWKALSAFPKIASLFASQKTEAIQPPSKPGIPPATQPQKDLAIRLGLQFPSDVNRREISQLITEAQEAGIEPMMTSDEFQPTQPQLEYAEKLGIPVSPGMTRKEMSNVIDALVSRQYRVQILGIEAICTHGDLFPVHGESREANTRFKLRAQVAKVLKEGAEDSDFAMSAVEMFLRDRTEDASMSILNGGEDLIEEAFDYFADELPWSIIIQYIRSRLQERYIELISGTWEPPIIDCDELGLEDFPSRAPTLRVHSEDATEEGPIAPLCQDLDTIVRVIFGSPSGVKAWLLEEIAKLKRSSFHEVRAYHQFICNSIRKTENVAVPSTLESITDVDHIDDIVFNLSETGDLTAESLGKSGIDIESLLDLCVKFRRAEHGLWALRILRAKAEDRLGMSD